MSLVDLGSLIVVHIKFVMASIITQWTLENTMAAETSGSWTNAKFRKLLLIESIASMISKKATPEIPPLPFENPSKHELNSEEEAKVKDVASRETSAEDKATGITPSTTLASSQENSIEKKSLNGSERTSMGSGGIANGDIMANHGEGGINYRSLLWW
jgi:hypothetical protein